ncbi:MAG: tail fiber domain-containing protein [Candidatus Marinimicrobia bacterium]|nr:tail fiber domain-containing protein [Candidatus Neomarinimicrobiota bacterium]
MKKESKENRNSSLNGVNSYPFMICSRRNNNKIIGGKTMKYLRRFIMTTALMFLAVNSIKAQSNPVVTMQGFLTDSTGRALPDGNYESKFRIYDDPTGGTLLWEESHDLILDHGLYDAFLGSKNSIDLPFDKDYWLSVEVEGAVLQQPRLRVGHSFVSLKALKSDSSGFAENAEMLAGKPASFYDPVTFLSFDSLSGTATDAQIPDNITINNAGNADSLGNVSAGDYTTDSELESHENDVDVHHARYTDTEAVSAMGAKSDGNSLNHDKTSSLVFGAITGTATDVQIPDNITVLRAASAGDADSLAGIAASAYALKSDIPTDGDGGEVVDGAFSTTSNVTSNIPGNLALDDFVFGSSQLDSDGIGDHNRRMFFDKSKGAFRAGFSNGDEWNDSNVGEFSTAFGQDTKASGNWSTAFGRDTEASGNWSIAMGLNAIADANNSIVIGSYANANNKNGAILLADASGTEDLIADNMNEFKVRAAGGTTIYSNSQMTSGVTLSAGGGAWSTLSDSTAKRNIRKVNTEEILDKVMKLPIKQWNYKSQSEEIEHIGPMAQDFYSIFSVGENDLTISTIDPSGVALAAIQELYKSQKELELKTEELGEMKKEIRELRELLNRIVGSSAR